MTFARLALVLALVAGCVHVPEAPVTLSGGSAPRSELPETFELLCWNIYKERRRGVVPELERFAARADLVLLQEAVRPDTLPTRSWTMVQAFRFVRGGAPAGVATGSVAPPMQQLPLHSPEREPFARTPKSALVTKVPIEGDAVLLVVNVHGVNFRRADALHDQLAALEPIVAEHVGPVVVAGDFNTWSPRRVAVVDAFAARLGLAPVFTDRGGPRLDGVFQRGLSVRHADVLTTRSSDHAALRVRFAVRSE